MSNPEENSAEKLLASVGLPPKFLENLLTESDWSCVIKIHALFEATLANLVVKKLNAPLLQDAIANLDFNNTKAGKVTFAQALELIDPQEVTFLRGLSELRNKLVHDVHNVGFNLKTYIESMDSNQRKSFKKSFGHTILKLADGEAQYNHLLTTNPILILIFAGYGCLMALEFNYSNHRQQALIKALMEHTKNGP